MPQISAVSVSQFRNFKQYTAHFESGINLIVGPNGAGKSSLLEAISFSAITKSYRVHRDQICIQEGESYFQTETIWKKEGTEHKIQVNYQKDKGKKIIFDEAPLEKFSDIIGFFPLVIQSPENSVLADGGSKEKRNFFDRLFVQISRPYLYHYQQYHHYLKQRNAILKELKQKKKLHYDPRLEFIDEKMLIPAWEISRYRKERIQDFAKNFYAAFSESFSRYEAEIRFQPSLDALSFGDYEREFQQRCQKNLESDILLSRTLTGPQSDRFLFLLNGQPLEYAASQGERKLWITLMKLTEGDLIASETGEAPLFLLDDLFAELDIENAISIVRRILSQQQLIITSTDLADLSKYQRDNQKLNLKVLNLR
jgi:DNA replication and repair protein RecF